LVFIKRYLLSLAHVIRFSPFRGSPELCLLPTQLSVKEVAEGIVIRRFPLCHFGVIILSSDTDEASRLEVNFSNASKQRDAQSPQDRFNDVASGRLTMFNTALISHPAARVCSISSSAFRQR
jgi:hypothetical protein